MASASTRSSLSIRRRQVPTRSWLAGLATAILLAALATGPATAATGATAATDDAGAITDWNAIAVSTLAGDTTKAPTEAVLYMAFVHAAVYDAVVGIEGRYAPYRFHAHAPRKTSAEAAAVAAAHKVLVTYSPYARPPWMPPMPPRWPRFPTARPRPAASPSGTAPPTT